jgi:CRP/FNR family transcriptional regulator, anaerobic regulatory protein
MQIAVAGCRFYQQFAIRQFSQAELAFLDDIKLGDVALPANQDLVQAGEVGGHLFLVTEGWAFRYKRMPDGRRFILDFLLSGDLVGMQSGLLGMIDHSVRTLTPTRLCVIDGRRIDEMYRGFPELALLLTKYFAVQERRTDDRATVLGRGTAVERLAFLMVEIFERLQRRGAANGSTCPFPLRRQHLADASGLTGAHVNRTLNLLREDGVAVIEQGTLTLLDPERLARLSGHTGAALTAP